MLNQLWLFRSYDNFPRTQDESPERGPLNPGRGTKFAAWKVARAATAAKMFFKPLEIALDDGEVIHSRRTATFHRNSSFHTNGGNRDHTATRKSRGQPVERQTALLSDAGFSLINNPSGEVRKELRSIFRNGPKKVENWVSIGTARQAPPGDTSSLKALLKRAVSQVGDPETVHESMLDLDGKEFNYYRLNEASSSLKVEMDDWKPRNSGSRTIEEMENSFNKWVRVPSNVQLVQEAAKNLVEIRRGRTTNISRWERFALGRLFICPAKDCYLDPDETWHYRDSFSQHLQTVHGYNEEEIKRAVRSSSRDWQYKARDMYRG